MNRVSDRVLGMRLTLLKYTTQNDNMVDFILCIFDLIGHTKAVIQGHSRIIEGR